MVNRLVCVLLCLLTSAASAAAQDLPADVCTTLRQVRGSAPITSNAEIGAMLNRVAWTHRAQGLGLSRKAGGNHCESPAGPIACDILQLRDGTAWDVLSSAGPGEPTSPNCGGSIGRLTDPARPFVAAVDPGDTPDTPDTPDTNPSAPPEPSADIATADLQRQQLAALVQIIQQLQAQNAELRAGLAEIKAAIAAGVKIRF
jgi:hypothetical protein